VAPRTISQIAGEFGLSRGAAADPFSQQETAVLSNVQRSLDDIRSQQLESDSARGFGRTTFSEGIFARKEADVLGQVGAQFAQARTTEALRESDFERRIITDEIGADRSSRALTESTAAETRLIGARGDVETDLIGARGDIETDLIGARGAETRTTLADQISGESAIASQQAEQRLTELERQKDVETDLISARGAESRAGTAAQISGQKELTTLSAQEKRTTISDQAGFALEQLQQQTQAREALARTAGQEQRLTQSENFIEQGKQLTQQAQINQDLANTQFENETALLDAKFDRIRSELPFELEQKAKFEKEILKTQLEVIREQKIIDTVLQVSLGYITSNLATPGGIGSKVLDVADDLVSNIL